MTLRPTTDRLLWDDLVRNAPGGTAFHFWDWLDLQAQVLEGVFERLVAYDGETPVGVLPVPRQSGSPLRRIHVPFPFVGPLVPQHLLVPTLRALRRRQLRHGPVLTRLEFAPDVHEAAMGGLLAAGCSARPLGTVVVDLSHGSPEKLFASYSSSRRREIRRARRNGADVRRAEPGDLPALLPRLSDEAFAVHGASNPYPHHTGRLVEEWAAGRDDVAVFAGIADDQPVGVAVVLAGHPTGLFWLGTSLREHRERHVNDLLYHAILEWALEQGCERMDLCGSVDEGILSYKRTFGGVEVPYTVGEATPLSESLIAVGRRSRSWASKSR